MRGEKKFISFRGTSEPRAGIQMARIMKRSSARRVCMAKKSPRRRNLRTPLRCVRARCESGRRARWDRWVDSRGAQVLTTLLAEAVRYYSKRECGRLLCFSWSFWLFFDFFQQYPEACLMLEPELHVVWIFFSDLSLLSAFIRFGVGFYPEKRLGEFWTRTYKTWVVVENTVRIWIKRIWPFKVTGKGVSTHTVWPCSAVIYLLPHRIQTHHACYSINLMVRIPTFSLFWFMNLFDFLIDFPVSTFSRSNTSYPHSHLFISSDFVLWLFKRNEFILNMQFNLYDKLILSCEYWEKVEGIDQSWPETSAFNGMANDNMNSSIPLRSKITFIHFHWRTGLKVNIYVECGKLHTVSIIDRYFPGIN